jgi:hypothetical protein
MMPNYQQQQQQPINLPNGGHNNYGIYQYPGYGPMNWQHNDNWSGGFVNGQQMPLQEPPFYYPFDILTAGPSNFVRKNQVQYQGRKKDPRTSRRGNLKYTEREQGYTPTQRRLVHFMPER